MVKINNEEELKHLTENSDNKMTILKFYGEWCNPCKMLSKVINEIESDFCDRVIFAESDVSDADENFVEKFEITNIPCVIFFKNGFQIDRMVGAVSKDIFIKKINENLEK